MNHSTIFRLSSIVAIAACATSFTACKKPRTGDVFTLFSPQSVSTTQVCLVEDEGQWTVAFADSEDCIHPADLVKESPLQQWDPHIYLAAISNVGEGALQTYALDTRSTVWLAALRSPTGASCLKEESDARQPVTSTTGQWSPEGPGDSDCSSITGTGIRSFDNVPSIPGNNGIALNGTLGETQASHLPGIHWVATSAPDTIAAVNVLTGKRVPLASGALQAQMDFPVADIAVIRDTGWLIAANPRDNELVAWQPTFLCDGEANVHVVGCALELDFGPATHIALQGAPRHLAAARTGDVYASADGVPFVTRVSLDDNECPPAAPCKIAITHTCNDGMDNDGNGLADADDPSCYTPTMDEGELFADAACADGLDNDGDGLIDALDPACVARSYGAEDATDASCTDGVDNDGDGLIDADDPKCASGSEFRAGTRFTRPGDAAMPRYTAQPVYPGRLVVAAEGDILIVAEAAGNRLYKEMASDLVFLCARPLADDVRPAESPCQEANTRIRLNAGDPVRDIAPGMRLNGIANHLETANLIEALPIKVPAGLVSSTERTASFVFLTTRRLFVSSSDGFLYSIDIDRLWQFVGNDGAPVDDYEALLRYTDASGSSADIRNMRLVRAERVPAIAGTFPTTEPGEDAFYPSLRAIDPSKLAGANGSRTRLDANNITNPLAFVELPTEPRFCFDFDGLGCLTSPSRDRQFLPYSFDRAKKDVVHDARIFDENWSVAWEGSLLIGLQGFELATQRNDAVVLNDDGWIEFLGKTPCETVNNNSQLLCDRNIGWSACPTLEALCQRGADLCGDDIKLCDLCPSACAAEVDLCEAGVQPGDIAILPPLDPASYCRRGEAGCNSNTDVPAQCKPGAGGDILEPGAFDIRVPALATIGNEYRVVEVKGNAIRVEPLGFNDRSRFRVPTRLPSTACYRKTLSVEIVAANSWTFSGNRVANTDTPYASADGFCAMSATEDGPVHVYRPPAGAAITTRYGLRLEILPGDYLSWCATQSAPEECAHAMRGFRVSFATEDAYSPRAISGVIGSMGHGGAQALNRNAGAAQLLFLDAGTNELAVINNSESLRGTLVP